MTRGGRDLESCDNFIANAFYRALQCFGNMLFGMMFRVKVVGERNIPRSGPVVIAANHASYLDPVFVGLKMRRRVRFIAWDAIFRVPGISFLARALGAFPVRLEQFEKTTYEIALDVLKGGHVFGIFPDGRRTASGLIESPKAGAVRLALKAGAPIVPCSIIGSKEAWPIGRILWGGGEVTVIFHKAIPPTGSDAPAKASGELIVKIGREIMETVNAAIVSPPVMRGAPLVRAKFRKVYPSASSATAHCGNPAAE